MSCGDTVTQCIESPWSRITACGGHSGLRGMPFGMEVDTVEGERENGPEGENFFTHPPRRRGGIAVISEVSAKRKQEEPKGRQELRKD